MSTPTSVSISKFSSAADKLDASGKNWVTFQHCFMIAVKQKWVFRHFDGTEIKPTLSSPATENKTKALTAWQGKEDTAMYLLLQKLDVWSAIILEFMQNSMVIHSNMDSKFMAMHYMLGVNLHTKLDHVHVKYETQTLQSLIMTTTPL
ncbi:hypothetical protein L208DRAFT_1260026 [Tricholoma matsutake]|nr:hypothetical protein L208DRAFT_1260026 [Tricholoma matsutake 945]